MKFNHPLIPGRLVRRRQRFLADIELSSGNLLTAHCPNSGSMLGCQQPGSPVRLSKSPNPGRKYPHTLEMIQAEGEWVGINTCRTNHLVREALENGAIAELAPIRRIKAEVKVSDRSRLDFLLTLKAGKPCYLEVKNCTLAEQGVARFPDAVTSRGARHLAELIALRRAGHRACVLFCVQRADAGCFAPAGHIDPAYAKLLTEARRQGVEVLAYQARVKPEEIRIIRPLPVHLAALAEERS